MSQLVRGRLLNAKVARSARIPSASTWTSRSSQRKKCRSARPRAQTARARPTRCTAAMAVCGPSGRWEKSAPYRPSRPSPVSPRPPAARHLARCVPSGMEREPAEAPEAPARPAARCTAEVMPAAIRPTSNHSVASGLPASTTPCQMPDRAHDRQREDRDRDHQPVADRRPGQHQRDHGGHIPAPRRAVQDQEGQQDGNTGAHVVGHPEQHEDGVADLGRQHDAGADPGCAEHALPACRPALGFGKENGTGLGLTVVQKIVQDHGGQVLMERTAEAQTVILPITLPGRVSAGIRERQSIDVFIFAICRSRQSDRKLNPTFGFVAL